MNAKCSYEKGKLTESRIRSTVLGTGETELISYNCTEMAYSTKDTGLSDNGKDTIVNLGSEISKNIRPGGQIESSLVD